MRIVSIISIGKLVKFSFKFLADVETSGVGLILGGKDGLLGLVKALHDAINYFQERGNDHDTIRMAAEKYRDVFKNPDFAKLFEDARTRLKISKLFEETLNIDLSTS